jgi:CDP-4-dehydro-6-deoxyglucose reductase
MLRGMPRFQVALHGTDQRFEVEDGETVLEAARRAGLALPYSCLGGICGSCKATVVSGEWSYPLQPPTALNAAERASHQVLLCQAVPRSDLVLVARQVPSAADVPRRVLPLKLRTLDRLAPDVARLDLVPPRGLNWRWLAGQYLDVLLSDGRRRAFSIANAPEQSDHVELHIRHIEGGGFTPPRVPRARTRARCCAWKVRSARSCREKTPSARCCSSPAGRALRRSRR